MKQIELKEMVGGVLQEQFAKSFEKVVENLLNPNTPFKPTRKITIELKFTQNEYRDDVHCAVLVSEKLASQSPISTSFAIGKDLNTGEVYAEEYGKQIKGQQSFDDINAIKVDADTGEVIEEPVRHSNIIDLRKTATS